MPVLAARVPRPRQARCCAWLHWRQAAAAPILHVGDPCRVALCAHAHGGACARAVRSCTPGTLHLAVTLSAARLLHSALLSQAGRRGAPVTAAHAADVRDDLRHGEVVLLEARVAGRVVARLVQELLRHVAVHALRGLSRAAQQAAESATCAGFTVHTEAPRRPSRSRHGRDWLAHPAQRCCRATCTAALASLRMQAQQRCRHATSTLASRLSAASACYGTPRKRAAPARRSAGARRCRA